MRSDIIGRDAGTIPVFLPPARILGSRARIMRPAEAVFGKSRKISTWFYAPSLLVSAILPRVRVFIVLNFEFS